MALGLRELLKLKGFDLDRPAKLLRHKDDRVNVESLLRQGWFDAYQSYQSTKNSTG